MLEVNLERVAQRLVALNRMALSLKRCPHRLGKVKRPQGDLCLGPFSVQSFVPCCKRTLCFAKAHTKILRCVTVLSDELLQGLRTDQLPYGLMSSRAARTSSFECSQPMLFVFGTAFKYAIASSTALSYAIESFFAVAARIAFNFVGKS